MSFADMSPDRYSLPALLKWVTAILIGVHMHTPAPLEIFSLLLMVDWLTGLGGAYIRGEVSSDVGRKGAMRKLLTVLFLWLLYAAESYARTFTGGSPLPPWLVIPAASTIATGYIINEIVSIVENMAKAGVPLPA